MGHWAVGRTGLLIFRMQGLVFMSLGLVGGGGGGCLGLNGYPLPNRQSRSGECQNLGTVSSFRG